jgi:hypothetical protein
MLQLLIVDVVGIWYFGAAFQIKGNGDQQKRDD